MGYKQTEEHIRKRITSLVENGKLKGKTPWNKGKKGLQTAWNKGKKGVTKLSEETKLKMSQAHLGHEGCVYSEKSLEKIREARKKQVGDKCPAWKGGITPINTKIRNSIQYRLWRESVFARDNWTCQNCGERGGELEAHHIKAFRDYLELRVAIDNGITYCKKCHKIIDDKRR